jgi:hypothetical protein
MQKISSKKWFFYISVGSLLCYFMFVLLMYNNKELPQLYSVETCNSYYLFVYLLLCAVAYCVDMGSRKEPGFLMLFCLPIFTFIYLLGCLFVSGALYSSFIILTLAISLLFVLGYIVNKYSIEKLLAIRNGYTNILFIYCLVHLMVALYISFKILGYM